MEHCYLGITYLNEVLAFRFGHQRLKFGSGEGVHQAGFRHDEEEYLSAGQNGQLVCLNPKVTGLVSIRSKIRSCKREAGTTGLFRGCKRDSRNAGRVYLTHLLHDARLTLREGNMTTRLVLDKLDVDLPPLAPGFIIVIFIIITGGARTLTFDTAMLLRTVPIAGRKTVILNRGRLGRIGDVGHEATVERILPVMLGVMKSRR